MNELLKNQNTTVVNERRNGTSASSAPCDLLCQGRHNAQDHLPDTPSDDSDFGNKIHETLVTGDATKLDTQQLNIYESIVEIEAKVVAQVFGADSDKVKVFKEERYWAKIPPDNFLHSGRSDLTVRFGTRGLIVDYKTLPGDVVEAPSNGQLRDLSVLSARALLLDEVSVAIVQPLVSHSPQLCVYSKDDITKAEQEMWRRVRASNQPNAPRTAGEIQCKFCKALTKCPEAAQYMDEFINL